MSDSRYKTEFAISRLIRYHGKRQRFFDGLHRMVSFINALAGSSAFVSIISGLPVVAAWLTAIVAVSSALDSVVGFSERARLYADQRSKYYDLYCDIVACKAEKFNSDHFRERRLRIDRDSPPPMRVLDVIARNEEDISRGYSRIDTIYINWFRRLLRHVVDLPPAEWKTIAQIGKKNTIRTALTDKTEEA